MEVFKRLKKKCPETAMEFLMFVTSSMKWSEFEKCDGTFIHNSAARFFGYSMIDEYELEYDIAIKYLMDFAVKYEESVIFVKENDINNRWSLDINCRQNEQLLTDFENCSMTDYPGYTGFYNAIKTDKFILNKNGLGMIDAIKETTSNITEDTEHIDLTQPKGDVPF